MSKKVIPEKVAPGSEVPHPDSQMLERRVQIPEVSHSVWFFL